MKNNDILGLFTYYVYAQSGGVFKNVRNSIRDLVVYKNGKTFLDLTESSFDENEKRRARLTRIFDRVYEKGYSEIPSQQLYQYLRHEALFTIFLELINQQTSFATSINKLCDIHPSKAFSDLTETEKVIFKSELRMLLDEIKRNSIYEKDKVPAYEVPEADDMDFTFSLTMNQVLPDLISIKNNIGELTELELNLQRLVASIQLRLNDYNKTLKLDNSLDTLSLIREGNLTKYTTALTLAESFNPLQYSDPIEVQNRIVELEEIESEIVNLNPPELYFQILSRYIMFKLPGTEPAKSEEVVQKLSSISLNRIEKIINDSILLKFKDNFLIISKTKKIRETGERLNRATDKLNKDTQKLSIILVESTLVYEDFLKIGFKTSMIKYIRLKNRFMNFDKIQEQASVFLRWESVSKETIPVPAEPKKTEIVS